MALMFVLAFKPVLWEDLVFWSKIFNILEGGNERVIQAGILLSFISAVVKLKPD